MTDDTKVFHIVTVLDPPTVCQVCPHWCTLHPQGIIVTFGLSEADRANRVLNLHGLGDWNSLALMDEMLALACQQCFLFKQLFLNQLPETLQMHLATVGNFALEADKLRCTKLAAPWLSTASTFVHRCQIQFQIEQVPPPLPICGKRQGRPPEVAAAVGPNSKHLFYISDCATSST